MDQDFGRDVISITNEEGEEFELEVLSSCLLYTSPSPRD